MNIRVLVSLVVGVFCAGCIDTRIDWSIDESANRIGLECFTAGAGESSRRCMRLWRHYKFSRDFPFPPNRMFFFKSDGAWVLDSILKTLVDLVTLPIGIAVNKEMEVNDEVVLEIDSGAWNNPRIHKLVRPKPCRTEDAVRSLSLICEKPMSDGGKVEFLQPWEHWYPVAMIMRIYKPTGEHKDVVLGFGVNGYNTWLIDDGEVLYVLQTLVTSRSIKRLGIFEDMAESYWNHDVVKRVTLSSQKVETLVKYRYDDFVCVGRNGDEDVREPEEGITVK